MRNLLAHGQICDVHQAELVSPIVNIEIFLASKEIFNMIVSSHIVSQQFSYSVEIDLVADDAELYLGFLLLKGLNVLIVCVL